MQKKTASATAIPITATSLRDWPLPFPSDEGDKEERGRVLVIGGSREIPGAVMLAAVAALHAGSGKVTIATAASIAPYLAVAIPEARVVALPETAEGGILPRAAEQLKKILQKIDAVLIGPGMQDEATTCEFIASLLPLLSGKKLILDASAMGIVSPGKAGNPQLSRPARSASDDMRPCFLNRFDMEVLLTPHAGEMAHLTGESKEAILTRPSEAALSAAQHWGACVALKGARTFLAAPDGRLWCHDGGNIGLAVSGSGDTLAGIITGLAARGACLQQACAWGVALHARAGDRLAERTGPLGFLARDISPEVPMLMHALLHSQA